MFKLLHVLLPCNSKLYKLKLRDSPSCTLCQSGAEEDFLHVFFECKRSEQISKWLLNIVRKKCPNISPIDILRLKFYPLKDDLYSIVWIVSNVLENIWQARAKNKKISVAWVRADLESRISVLRKSRLVKEANQIMELLSLLI